jgi:hypothetical protein
MTTAINSNEATPFYAWSVFSNTIPPFWDSLWESTAAAFRRVSLLKQDANGGIRSYDKHETTMDPKTGQLHDVTHKKSIYTYIEDVKTGELYYDEPQSTVTQKCIAIGLALPLYALGKICWNLISTPLEVGEVALRTLRQVGHHLLLGKLYEGSLATRVGSGKILQIYVNGLYELAKAPIFMVGAELAAIYGIFKPYHGRKFEAMIEKAWQNGVSFKEDLRKIPKREGEGFWEAFVKDLQNFRAFYLAHCFQVRGKTQDPNIIILKREPL